MSKNGTVVYNCHVDWDWIRQRPQFIAEGLSEYYDVFVHYRKQYCRKELQDNSKTPVHLCPYRTLPAFGDRFWWLTKRNLSIKKNYFNKLLKQSKANTIWLTCPTQVYEIPKSYHGMIIYDCMDDHIHLACPKAWLNRMRDAERALVNRADIVFASSCHLMFLLRSRYPGSDEKIHLIRNACSEELAKMPYIPIQKDSQQIVAGYIGTISLWFDFASLMESLDRFPVLHYWLIGPTACSNMPKHPRLHYLGVIPHENLKDYVSRINFFVMPFLINEITESVDPVKLYEYIAFGREIICSDYAETHYFNELVHFYKDTETYCEKVSQILKMETTPSLSEREAFLSKNTWKDRIESIILCLEQTKHINIVERKDIVK